VEIFSRSRVRPSISLRIDSIETWARGKSVPSTSCPRASTLTADVPARWLERQTATLRNERRRLPGALFLCSVQTLFRDVESGLMITMPDKTWLAGTGRIITYQRERQKASLVADIVV